MGCAKLDLGSCTEQGLRDVPPVGFTFYAIFHVSPSQICSLLCKGRALDKVQERGPPLTRHRFPSRHSAESLNHLSYLIPPAIPLEVFQMGEKVRPREIWSPAPSHKTLVWRSQVCSPSLSGLFPHTMPPLEGCFRFSSPVIFMKNGLGCWSIGGVEAEEY